LKGGTKHCRPLARSIITGKRKAPGREGEGGMLSSPGTGTVGGGGDRGGYPHHQRGGGFWGEKTVTGKGSFREVLEKGREIERFGQRKGCSVTGSLTRRRMEIGGNFSIRMGRVKRGGDKKGVSHAVDNGFVM